MSITGGRLVAQMLRAEGVEVVFGIVDGSYFGLCEGLRQEGIRLVSPRHETTGAHMAGAYARMTGRVGVCMASNGPGAANILPGVAVENGEGNRVLVLTSWRRSPIVGPDRGGTYQYFDQPNVIRPMAKWSGAARSFERVPQAVRRAFRVAWEGRPGVVHLSVPEDVLNGQLEDEPELIAPARYRGQQPLVPSAAQVRDAAERLAAADRPLLQVGSGVVHAAASDAVMELARLLRAPVTTSWGGRPAIDERLANKIPMMPPLVDEVRCEADVVLALGTRFGETDWWGKPPYWGEPDRQQVIQVDCDPEVLGTNRPVDLAIQADVGVFAEALLGELKSLEIHDAEGRQQRIEEWAQRSADLRGFLKGAAQDENAAPMHSAFVPLICRDFFDDEAVLVIDGGNTAVWTNLYHEHRTPGCLLSTFKFGMLGAGIGQALGARVACPERPVYAIVGDGAMGFHVQEIETAVRHELPIIVLVLCDRQWGMVKFSQSMALDAATMESQRMLPAGANLGTDFEEIRYDEVARAMGAHGERVSRASELRPALERCVASGKPAVVHVDVDPVAHLWAPGLEVFKKMHQEPGA
jgi:acetolactate synthase-1/2/3 large subunit